MSLRLVCADKKLIEQYKEGLIATALVVNDLCGLPTANEEDRDYIFNLRKKMIFTSHESGPRGSLQIDVDLKIPDPETK